jgi:hypothetical protein
MAVNLKISPKKSGGVQYLSFPNDKDGRKAMASCGITTKLASASHQKILQWVAEHPVKLENPAK